MVFRKKSSIKKRTPYKKRATRPVRKPAVSFEKRVKTVISKMAENKMTDFRAVTNLHGSNGTSWNTTIIPVTPFQSFLSIAQGMGQGERIGNSIRIKKLQLKGVICPKGYNATTNPFPRPGFLKLFFLTRKDAPMELQSTITDVFQYAGSSEGFGTALYNLQRPINTDEWMVHTTRTFKVGYASATSIGAGAVGDSHYYANNDFKLANFFNIDLTKYCVKTIKFDDNSVNPSTRNIVMYPVWYSVDNATLGTTEIPASLHYDLHIEYEDMYSKTQAGGYAR